MLAAQSTAVLLTSVRGALVAAVIGCAAAVLAAGVRGRPGRHWRRFALVTLAALAAVAVAAGITLMRGNGGIPDRLSPRGDDTLVQRIQMWRAAAQALIHSGPRLIIGYGPETQMETLEPWLPSAIVRPLSTIRVDRAHLSPLDVLLTTGILGGVAVAALWLTALRSAWRVAASDPMSGLFAAGAFGALVAHLVETSVAFPSITSLTIVAVLLGGVAGLWDQSTITTRPAARTFRDAPPARLWPLVALPFAMLCAAPMLMRLQADRAYQRSLALWANEQPFDAIAMTREAARLAPDQDVYALALAQQLLDTAVAAPRENGGRPAVLDGDPDAFALLRQSVESGQAAVELAPTDPFAWAALARSLGTAADAHAIEPSAGLEAAQLAATNAVRLGPQRSKLRDLAGRLALQADAPADALAIFGGTIALEGQDAERLAYVGHAHRELGNLVPAKRAYDQAIRLDERNAAAWWGLSRIHLAAGDPSEALEAARRAARFEMGNWRYRRHLGQLLLHHGLTDEARDELRLAVRLAPSWEWPALRTAIESIRSP
jgi:tetratricopeptide (TPR) repeat protein